MHKHKCYATRIFNDDWAWSSPVVLKLGSGGTWWIIGAKPVWKSSFCTQACRPPVVERELSKSQGSTEQRVLERLVGRLGGLATATAIAGADACAATVEFPADPSGVMNKEKFFALATTSCSTMMAGGTEQFVTFSHSLPKTLMSSSTKKPVSLAAFEAANSIC